MRRGRDILAGRRAPLLAVCGKIAPPAVPLAALVCGVVLLSPVHAAELEPAPLHAGHCVGALIDQLDFRTSAMVPTTARATGQPDADPRAERYEVPQENAVFSVLDYDGTRACVVAPTAATPGWARTDVERDLRDMGLTEAPGCTQKDVTLWVWPARNGAGRSVSVGIEGDADEVRWLMAFETSDVTNPEECRYAG